MKKLFFVVGVGMFLLAAGFGVFLRPLLYTLTPLQRYYLGAYLASSWHEKDPSAMSEIQWIWKFKPAAGSKKSKPNLQYSLATEADLVPIPARELLWKGDILPFWMNRKAELDGWTGIERGLPTEVNSAKLAALLREEFFYGEPVWHYFLQPALLLVAALLLWLPILSWRSARRERYLWGRPVPLWRELGQNPNDRVLLVGDRRQHEAVEAGRPFAQLQDAGMKTVKLEEIVRQKDPELKQVVEQLARGEVRDAVQSLERQGRVYEIAGREERIAAIAKEYAKSPVGTLVVSPDNRSRVEINLAIRTEMQDRGLVSKDEHRIETLVPRQDLTGPERTWAAHYEFNDVVRYARTSRETGMERGEYARVKSVDAEKNLLTVVRADGSELTYDPRRQQGVSVYREEPRSFAVGDRIQFTAPANDLKVANRELGTVEAIHPDGQMRLKMDGGRDVHLDPHEHPHLDHGYAVTSHSSQGQTAERVLIHVDTELAAKDLLNSRMAYVAVSRGANDAQLYTNDRQKLPEALGHDVSHESAHTPAINLEQSPAIKPEQSITPPQPEIAPKHEHSYGYGLEL